MNNVCNANSLDDIFDNTHEAVDGTSRDSLRVICELVDRLKAHEASVLLYEQKIDTTKDSIKILREIAIPEAMAEVGMNDIGLDDGMRLKIEAFHHGNITEKTRKSAHLWLEQNGFSGLIKHEVKINFGRDEDGIDGLRAYAREMGISTREKEFVHPATLNAFIRERAEAGDPVPPDLFNVYSGTRAVIK